MIKPTSHLLLPIVLISMLAISTHSAAFTAKLYKWVDEDGNISYQDSPPPENAKILSEKSTTLPDAPPVRNSNQPPVLVYTVPNCSSCDSLLARLRELNVPVEEHNLNDNRQVQQQILQQSSSLVAPSVFIKQQFHADFTADNMETILRSAGYELESQSGEPATTDDTSNETR